MLLSDFSFDVPDQLIAQYPSAKRSASRLLILDGATGSTTHKVFSALPEQLNANDLLVINNTRVIPARLFGVKETGGKIELMFERVLDNRQVLTRIRASKSPKPGAVLHFGIQPEVAQATIIKRDGEFFVLEFAGGFDPLELLKAQGSVPLPPYITRLPDADDTERYQTIYSKHPGAVAAPTAGLHFDQSVFDALSAKGVDIATVTLHVGAGTFQPIRVDDPDQHQMHAEHVQVSEETVQKIVATKARGGRVIAVGTTSVRSLETAASGGTLAPFAGDTRIFIKPGTPFRVVDGMITNFHLPESTLIMLVAAFSGRQHILAAYRQAVEQEYRFYSYGDAMLLWPDRRGWAAISRSHSDLQDKDAHADRF